MQNEEAKEVPTSMSGKAEPTRLSTSNSRQIWEPHQQVRIQTEAERYRQHTTTTRTNKRRTPQPVMQSSVRHVFLWFN
jgi:hypothetical protein